MLILAVPEAVCDCDFDCGRGWVVPIIVTVTVVVSSFVLFHWQEKCKKNYFVSLCLTLNYMPTKPL